MAYSMRAAFYVRTPSRVSTGSAIDPTDYSFGCLSDWLEVDATTPVKGRNYLLFTYLTNTPFGVSFKIKGRETPVQGVAKPRGLPSMFAEDRSDDWFERFLEYQHSWLTVDEILEWYAKEDHTPILRGGYVSRAYFEQWDGVTEPDTFWGGSGGPGIRHATWSGSLPESGLPTVDRDSEKDWTDIYIWWYVTPKNLPEEFFEELRTMKRDYPDSDIVMVFGFG